MKTFLKILVVAVVVGAAVHYWPKIFATVSGLFDSGPVAAVVPPPKPAQTAAPAAEGPDLSPRMWTNRDGRHFEGALVYAKQDLVIVRRSSDSACFRIVASELTESDQSYIQKQSALAAKTGAGFTDQVDGVYTLSRKLAVKGDVVFVQDRSAVGGGRHDRVDPKFWFFLSSKLDDTDVGSVWVRIDEKTYNAHAENTLITRQQLLDFMDTKGGFSESLPWPRPRVTVIDSKYGTLGQSFNVTDKLMHVISEGRLPVEISPELFGLPPHAPESWELTVFWRTGTGEMSRTLRDHSILSWP